MGYGQSREKAYSTFNVIVCIVKDKSICLARNTDEFDKREGTWFPLSQCRLPNNPRRGDTIDVEIADWIVEKNGW